MDLSPIQYELEWATQEQFCSIFLGRITTMVEKKGLV